MSKNNDPQRGQDTPSRVYKRSDVHKRRVDRKGRAKGEAPSAEPGALDEPAAAEDPSEGGAPQEGAENSAVVITPEFGRRSKARREADDRWFAAMREDDLSGAKTAPGGSAAASPSAGVSQHTQPLPPVDAGQSAQPSQPAVLASEGQSGQPAQPEQSAQPAQSEQAGQPGQSEQPEQAGQPAPSESSGKDDRGEESAADAKEPSPRRLPARILSSRKARIGLIVGAVVLVAAIVAASLFTWNRWYRYDDHADMQGTWYVVGTTTPITIDETSIHLNDEVTYVYEIDQHDKTIRYTFGPMSGQGRYWLSDDRQYLVITDGDGFDATSTAIEDLLHAFADLGDYVTGSDMKLPEGEGIIAFGREPDPAALRREQREAAEKAAAEAAARKAAEEEAARIAAEEAAAWEEYYYYEEEPAEEVPAEEAPAEDAPVEETSVDEPPADGGSAEEAYE